VPDAGSIADAQDFTCAVTVRNSGARAGREVVQLYLEGPDDDPSRPSRVLAAFASISADAGARITVRLTVPARMFARFDETKHDWIPHPGTYAVHAGRSSRDLRLNAKVVLR
jgi:beta-glucosidase